MKDCRFCGKPMHEGGSFCPHCMRRQDEPDSLDNTPISPPKPTGKRRLIFLLPILLLSVPAIILIWYLEGQMDPLYQATESDHLSSLNVSSSRPSAPSQSTAPPTTSTSVVYTTTEVTKPPVTEPPFDLDAVIQQLSATMEATGAYVADSDISSMKLVMLNVVAPVTAMEIENQMQKIESESGHSILQAVQEQYTEVEYLAPFKRRYHLEYVGFTSPSYHSFRLYIGLTEDMPMPEISGFDVQKVIAFIEEKTDGKLQRNSAVYTDPRVYEVNAISRARTSADVYITAEEQAADIILQYYRENVHTRYELYVQVVTADKVIFGLYLA